MDKLLQLMNSIGLPFAYDHFAEGEVPELPYCLYLLPGSDNFAADGRVYFRISTVHIELYTDRKDPAAEKLVEDALEAASVFYNKTEVWISGEQLYEVLYQFEMEVMNRAEE